MEMVYSLRFSLVVIKERRYPQNGRWVAQQNGSGGILYVVKFEFFVALRSSRGVVEGSSSKYYKHGTVTQHKYMIAEFPEMDTDGAQGDSVS